MIGSLRRPRRCLALLAWIALAAPTALPAQGSQGFFNPRDDQYRLLGLIRAQAEFEQAAADYDRGRQLHEAAVITTSELEHYRAAFERARVNYLQQSLVVVFAAPHVSIERALKRRGADGRTRVRLTLRNTTGGGLEGARVSDLIEPELLERLRPDEVYDVHVSLKADPGLGGTIISQPYEVRVPVLRAGEDATLELGLLRDTDEVVVSISYGENLIERRILLEADPSADIVAVQSVQFSQEIDLGGQAVYDLRLDRFTADRTVFRLAALGLPRDVRHEFRDPETGARLTQVRFPEGQSQRNLQLAVSLPQRAGGDLVMDEPIGFWAVVLDEDAHAGLVAIDAADGGIPERLDALRAGATELELVPRGVGRLEVRAVNLFHEIRRGERVDMDVTVRNTGTRRLDNVRLRVDAPLGWDAGTEPDAIDDLPTGEERNVLLTLTPPPDVVVGDYEARFRTESEAADRRVETDARTVRVHVSAGTNWPGVAAVVLLLLGLVAGVVGFAVRLARR